MARLKLIYILLLIRSGYLSWQRKEREEGGPPPQTSKAFSQYSLFLKVHLLYTGHVHQNPSSRAQHLLVYIHISSCILSIQKPKPIKHKHKQPSETFVISTFYTLVSLYPIYFYPAAYLCVIRSLLNHPHFSLPIKPIF